MAKLRSITLSNFKGADAVTIDLANRIDTPVVTLIGLNESGKTTILEGLSHFVTADDDVLGLFGELNADADLLSLIPLQKKAAFTGTIEISAIVVLDDRDFERASRRAKTHKLVLDRTAFPSEFIVATRYHFKDSAFERSALVWDFELRVRTKAGKEKKYRRPPEDSGKADLWDEITDDFEKDLPRIAYFPTFLVEMPDRIYLKEYDDEPATNRFYRSVFQDVLDSVEGGLSLERHVCKRIEDFKAAKNSPLWISFLFGAPDKRPIDSVFQKISSEVTKQVLGSWKRIFQRSIAAKSISVDWNIDAQKDGLPYASFYVSDGEAKYSISERSLGFRWFFSFLLFTAFKRAAKRPTLFLFDEPAANLHARAQAELLASFSKIVEEGHRIVYSTHSHHMINTAWLSGAYIIENTALDYDALDQFGLNAKPTHIVATSYRQFVAQTPDRTSYFQPVIEKLEYVTPKIVGSAPFVLLEGITDFYAFTLIYKDRKGKVSNISFMPGTGASALGPQINLLLGRGERFVILLDDDKKGREAAEMYRDKWYLSRSDVMTVADLNEKWKGGKLEGLLGKETQEMVKRHFGISSSPSKKQIGLYLAEMCAVGAGSECTCAATKANIGEIIDLISARI